MGGCGVYRHHNATAATPRSAAFYLLLIYVADVIVAVAPVAARELRDAAVVAASVAAMDGILLPPGLRIGHMYLSSPVAAAVAAAVACGAAVAAAVSVACGCASHDDELWQDNL